MAQRADDWSDMDGGAGDLSFWDVVTGYFVPETINFFTNRAASRVRTLYVGAPLIAGVQQRRGVQCSGMMRLATGSAGPSTADALRHCSVPGFYAAAALLYRREGWRGFVHAAPLEVGCTAVRSVGVPFVADLITRASLPLVAGAFGLTASLVGLCGATGLAERVGSFDTVTGALVLTYTSLTMVLRRPLAVVAANVDAMGAVTQPDDEMEKGAAGETAPRPRTGFTAAVAAIWRKDGLSGFFRGSTYAVGEVLAWRFLQGAMTAVLLGQPAEGEAPTLRHAIVAEGISFIASTIIHPLRVFQLQSALTAGGAAWLGAPASDATPLPRWAERLPPAVGGTAALWRGLAVDVAGIAVGMGRQVLVYIIVSLLRGEGLHL